MTDEKAELATADLSTLREILLGEDRERLEALNRRLGEPQLRADDVAEVLPEAFVREFARSPHRLKEAVRQPIEETLREAVRTDPRPVADAIFPVIGPAIRRYITASMRALAESLSRTIERGLSPRRQLAWRFKAWRSGLSFGQYVLQRTFVYRVEHVYLIQAGSGLLMGEAHHDDSPMMDSDAISGMLSALQSFVVDSFELADGHQLQTADLGEFTLWAIHGPHAMLACAIRGTPGGNLRQRLEEALENMHLRYGRWIESFDGRGRDTAPPGLEEALEGCLYKRHQEEPEGRRRIGIQTWLVLFAAASFLLRMIGGQVAGAMAVGRLERTLQATPGIVLTSIERRRDRIRVSGLRDPLAPSFDRLVEEAALGERTVVADLSPFQSLEPSLVMARVQRALDPPDSVDLRLEEAVLFIAGEADAQWVDRARRTTLLSPAIERVDTSRLRVTPADLLALLEQRLAPPESVELSLSDGRLTVSGTAPVAWLERAPLEAARVPGVRAVDAEQVRAREIVEAEALVARIGERPLLFELDASSYRPGGEEALRANARDVLALVSLAARLERPLSVQTVGYTDARGADARNAALRRARAERVRDDLVRLGVPAGILQVRAADAAADADPELRRVEVRPVIYLGPWRPSAP